MIFAEEISVSVPSYSKFEKDRITIILDLAEKFVFVQIPGRNLDNIPWVQEFRNLDRGEEAISTLLDRERRIRWSEGLEEKIFSSIFSSSNSEFILVDTVNWVSRRLPREWIPSQSLIESRRAFSIGKFEIDVMEAQFLKLIPKVEKFMLQKYERIHAPNFQVTFPEKADDCKMIYEKLMFLLLVQFEDPCVELTDAKERLRKFFQVEICPFETHMIGSSLYWFFLSDATPFVETARKIVYEVNNFPAVIPSDICSVLYLFLFWDLNFITQRGVRIPEPFPSSTIGHIKSVDMAIHDTLENVELAASFPEIVDFDFEFTV